MASATEQEACTHCAKRQPVYHSEAIAQLPYEILEAIFRTLPTAVVVHRVGAVCKDWHAIAKDDELWRLRCGLSELPSGFSSWFAYAQRRTMCEQALDHLYGRAGLTQNWRKGLQLLSVLSEAGDDYAMALYGWALVYGLGISEEKSRGRELLQQSNNPMARAWCLGNVSGNHTACFTVLSMECEPSDLHVQNLLGDCHLYGWGCVRSSSQAVQCYERAGNHVPAMNTLGSIILGVGEPEQARAAVLYRRAAEQGYRIAQHNIAVMYEKGYGVPKDLRQAKHWYTLAAEQEYPPSQMAQRRMA